MGGRLKQGKGNTRKEDNRIWTEEKPTVLEWGLKKHDVRIPLKNVMVGTIHVLSNKVTMTGGEGKQNMPRQKHGGREWKGGKKKKTGGKK